MGANVSSASEIISQSLDSAISQNCKQGDSASNKFNMGPIEIDGCNAVIDITQNAITYTSCTMSSNVTMVASALQQAMQQQKSGLIGWNESDSTETISTGLTNYINQSCASEASAQNTLSGSGIICRKGSFILNVIQSADRTSQCGMAALANLAAAAAESEKTSQSGWDPTAFLIAIAVILLLVVVAYVIIKGTGAAFAK